MLEYKGSWFILRLNDDAKEQFGVFEIIVTRFEFKDVEELEEKLEEVYKKLIEYKSRYLDRAELYMETPVEEVEEDEDADE